MENELKEIKATVYSMGDFGMGYRKVEVRKLATEFRQWAQYSNALQVAFVKKGGRQALSYVDSHFDGLKTLILEGHNHPDPPSMWASTTVSADGTKFSTGKYRSCDPRWAGDFNNQINTYIAETGAKVLIDARGVSPYAQTKAA